MLARHCGMPIRHWYTANHGQPAFPLVAASGPGSLHLDAQQVLLPAVAFRQSYHPVVFAVFVGRLATP